MDGVGKGYRVPKLEEFVQGFKFQKKNSYRFMLIDFANDKTIKSKEYHDWVDCEVWWKHPEDAWITSPIGNEGHTITQKGSSINWFKPFDEQSYINQKIVRVKIKNK